MTSSVLAAALILSDVLPYPIARQGQGASLRSAITQAKAGGDWSAEAQFLAYTACRHYKGLDTWLQTRLQKPMRDKDRVLYFLLVAGVTQLVYGHGADHAVTDNAVKATRQLGRGWASGMVNAILRECIRQRAAARKLIDDNTALPDWLATQLSHDWPGQAGQLITASLQPPPLCLRNNERGGSRAAMLATLQQAGIGCRPGALGRNAIYLDNPMPVDTIPGFAEGLLSVQDEAAQLAVEAFSLPTDRSLRILDACAAPGGKTAYLCEMYGRFAEIIAIDSDPERISSIAQNLERGKLNAQVVCADAADVDAWWDGKPFDAVLLDAPCSATGVLRRNPDAIWHRRPEDISALQNQQRRLWQALWPLVADGGQLVYATCSLLRAENHEQVASLLSHFADARLLGPDSAGGQQLFPQPDAHDGFFIARLGKSPKR